MKQNQEHSTLFTKRTYDGKPPRKNKSFPLRIAAYLAAIVVLAGGTFLMSRMLPDQNTAAESENLLKTPILQLKPQDVKSISVKGAENFTLLCQPQTQTTESGSKTEYIWQLEGVAAELLNLSVTESYANGLLHIDALRTMTGTNGDYGFPSDGAGITILMQNGTTHTLQFGAESMDAIGNYLLLDGSTVYVVESSVAEKTATVPADFADLTIINALPAEEYTEYVTDNAITGFDRLTLTKKGSPAVVITAKKTNNAFEYGMESPKSTSVSTESMQPVLSILQSGLTADGLYSYTITSPQTPGRILNYEEFKAAAAYTALLKLGNTEIELAISEEVNGNYTLVCKGKNAAYRIAAARLADLIDLAKA